MEINVRLSETNMLGHINHTSYFSYMEEGRIAYLEELDISFSSKEYSIILNSAKCDFIKQSYLYDALIVKTKINKIDSNSFNIGSDIFEKESNELITKGEVTLMYFDINQQKYIDLPESFKEKLVYSSTFK